MKWWRTMVNLRRIANAATSRINPNITIGLERYVPGPVIPNPDGTTAPSYDPSVPIVGQVQALGKKDIDHLSALNISDCERMVYVNFQLQATDRVAQTGGDLLTFEGRKWLVMAILEGWTTAGWSRAAVSKQMDAL